MKKYIKWLSIMLIVLMTVSSVPVGFAETPLEISRSEGTAQGEAFGAEEGADAGKTDYRLGRVSNYLLNMPSNAQITTRYRLNYDDANYRSAFLVSFKVAYEIGYRSAYREANFQTITAPYAEASGHGNQLGEVQGQIAAMIDFYRGFNNDWERAYRSFIMGGTLESRYYLTREEASYISKFKSGFIDSFMTGYITAFQNTNLQMAMANTNYKLIDMYETTIDFADEAISFTGGSMAAEASTPISLYFPDATLYQPTYFSVYKVQNSFNQNNAKYVPVSSKFTVAISNSTGSVTLRNPITLSFVYYGSERAGIYQWKNNQWVYQYTTLEEGKISTQIPAGAYSGGEYAIFIDETFKNIQDIGFNWANKEIYTLMRRGVVADTIKYYPEKSITKAELAQMIYLSMRAKNPFTGAGTHTFADAADYGGFKTAIEYVVSKGYMPLDAAGVFSPNSNVSYASVEAIFSKMFLRDFRWSEIATKMRYEKFTLTEGTTNKAASLTRAEAAYMIHELIR